MQDYNIALLVVESLEEQFCAKKGPSFDIVQFATV